MEDTMCCDAMQQVETEYAFPFIRPVSIDPATLNFRVNDLAIQLHKKTIAGRVSRAGQATVFVNFCPFCGKRLREVEVRE